MRPEEHYLVSYGRTAAFCSRYKKSERKVIMDQSVPTDEDTIVGSAFHRNHGRPMIVFYLHNIWETEFVRDSFRHFMRMFLSTDSHERMHAFARTMSRGEEGAIIKANRHVFGGGVE